MTPAELQRLAPYFSAGEQYVSGQPIEWSIVNFKTMMWLKALRQQLGQPILLIRGPHPNRPEAVDACCPALSLRRVFMELCRIPFCSWGLYSGNSFHLDTREYADLPARWLAVHTSERGTLVSAQLEDLVTSEKDGWLYLPWSHALSWKALEVMFVLADGKRGLPRMI
ncbi:hypothetical protein [Nitrospira sp. Nam74]